ncbi:unnamed protein product [Caenorhabditis brenneri]
MYVEEDEGIDSHSIHGSFRREYPTFMPDESPYRPTPHKSENTIIFPQRLDLSTMEHYSTPKKLSKGNKKKISPIKKCDGNELNKPIDLDKKTTINFDKGSHKSVDLDAFQRTFDEIAHDIIETSFRKGSQSSVTSDRGSSVSSSSSAKSLGQKSIFMQVSRANQLIKNKIEAQEKERKHIKNNRNAERKDSISIADSDFHLTTDCDENEETDTRPPSSQASLTSERVEHPRHSNPVLTSNQISSLGTSEHSAVKQRNAGTMSDTLRVSDTELAEIYKKRSNQKVAPKCSRRHYPDDEVTLTEDPANLNKTIVDEVFEDFENDFRSVSNKETPIFRTNGRDFSSPSLSSNRIEHARGTAHRSVSLNNIMSSSNVARRMGDKEVFDGNAPGALRHSISTVNVSPQKLRELRKDSFACPAVPNLARFAIKPSTRDIFPLPLDIDAISTKGLRKDVKSAQRIFGGKTVASQIHGEKFTTRHVTIPQKSSGAARPTTASAAKKVNFQTPSLTSAPKTFTSHNLHLSPPKYCSATTSDGTAYSLSSVSQQLLGTVKSLHPDWLQMIRRLLNDVTCEDVASKFRDVLLEEKGYLENKYHQNKNEDPFEEHLLARIAVISRVLDRMEELGNGRSVSRIQQIKNIHSALLKT